MCGAKEASQCVQPDGSRAEWGCYTRADTECACNANPHADGGRYSSRHDEAGGDDDDRYGRGRRASEYDDDDQYDADDEYRGG